MSEWLNPKYHIVLIDKSSEDSPSRLAMLERLRGLEQKFSRCETHEEHLAALVTTLHMELAFRSGYRSYEHMARVMDEKLGLYDEDNMEQWVFRHDGWMFHMGTFGEILNAVRAGVHEGLRIIGASMWMYNLYDMIDDHALASLLKENGVQVKIKRDTAAGASNVSTVQPDALFGLPQEIKFALVMKAALAQMAARKHINLH